MIISSKHISRLPWEFFQDLLPLITSSESLLRAAAKWAGPDVNPCDVPELTDYLTKHMDMSISFNTVMELAAQMPHVFSLVNFDGFFLQLNLELQKFRDSLTRQVFCSQCRRTRSVFHHNNTLCFDLVHNGTHQGRSGWDCCDAKKMRAPGCCKQTTSYHRFDVGGPYPILHSIIGMLQ